MIEFSILLFSLRLSHHFYLFCLFL